MVWPDGINKLENIPTIWCGKVYVIESDDNVELLDVQEVVARPEKITIIANEFNPLDWHGWLEIGRCHEDLKALSSQIYSDLTLRFSRNGSRYSGVARIVSSPVATGKHVRLDVRGVDVLYISQAPAR